MFGAGIRQTRRINFGLIQSIGTVVPSYRDKFVKELVHKPVRLVRVGNTWYPERWSRPMDLLEGEGYIFTPKYPGFQG
jgi:hypothetical protein